MRALCARGHDATVVLLRHTLLVQIGKVVHFAPGYESRPDDPKVIWRSEAYVRARKGGVVPMDREPGMIERQEHEQEMLQKMQAPVVSKAVLVSPVRPLAPRSIDPCIRVLGDPSTDRTKHTYTHLLTPSFTIPLLPFL